jgi:hypothetical protein
VKDNLLTPLDNDCFNNQLENRIAELERLASLQADTIKRLQKEGHKLKYGGESE